jgi:ureidoacrylate peracid hydrolase
VAGALHPSGLDERVVAKVLARRGRLHAFETIPCASTALVVVDLTTASVLRDANCLPLVPRINALAAAVRAGDGTVGWVTTASQADDLMIAQYGIEAATRFARESSGDDAVVWRELDVSAGDLKTTKRGSSAFFPSKCDLATKLTERGVTHVLIAGTVTNVCCESSARDAVELGFRVTMISDACAGHAHGLHEATLNTFYRCFGDVRPTDDCLAVLRASTF